MIVSDESQTKINTCMSHTHKRIVNRMYTICQYENANPVKVKDTCRYESNDIIRLFLTINAVWNRLQKLTGCQFQPKSIMLLLLGTCIFAILQLGSIPNRDILFESRVYFYRYFYHITFAPFYLCSYSHHHCRWACNSTFVSVGLNIQLQRKTLLN